MFAAFFPSKADEDIWMKDCGDHCKYIAMCVNKLLIASKNPQWMIDYLTSEKVNLNSRVPGR